MLPAYGVSGGVHYGWWIGAGALVVGMLLAWRLIDHRIGLDRLNYPVALVGFVVIVMLELADRHHGTAYQPLVILPVAWSALYETGRRLATSLVAAALALFLPIVIIGGAGYPGSSWRRSLLWLVVLAVIASAVFALVRVTRRSAVQLSFSEMRYRTAFAEAPVPIAIIGIEGDERGILLQANHPLDDLLGCTDDTAVGRSITEFVHRDDLEALSRTLFDADTQTVRSAEVKLTQRSGRVRWVSASVALVRYGADDPPRCICHFEDITVRRESEHALLEALEKQGVAAKQMREVAQARSDLVSAVSHDVRTPLTTIGAYVQLLEAGDAGELTADQRGMLDVISQNLRRTYAITEDLLTLGRLEHAGEAHPAEEVPIGTVVERVVEAIGPSARARRQQVVIDSHLGGARVAGHAGQLDRVLSNLLTNAVKFTPEGGTITVCGRSELGSVVIDVTDTGPGIATEEQERIFERFYRSDAVERRRVAGTGLGLAIAREIAALHGGTITVRSTPGAGATFTLTLPALARAA
ncbi:MAG TPA: ATP-binding protein [Jatrophihabitans sp.]|nr:ATP-binding protein [Jatrophihabitans sp.]